MNVYSKIPLYLLSAGLTFAAAAPALAACVSNDCSALGYTKSESACSGDIIRCPFDTSKVFCKALDDNCPSGYSKTACSSSQVQIGSQTTEAGNKCYKCEDYCSYYYSSYNNDNERRRTMILTSTCSGWTSWMGRMSTNETKLQACQRDNIEHTQKINNYNNKCPNRKISKIYTANCTSCCYSTNGRPGYLQICRDNDSGMGIR